MDVFKLAKKKWLHGERIDIGKLAVDLGVGRATVFRWVGSRENLYGEIISAGFTLELEKARAESKAEGIELLFDTIDRLLHALVASVPLKRFIEDDPEFALRVITSKQSSVQHRCMEAFRDGIEEQVAAKTMVPALPTEELAYLLVRIVESFLYRDVITGDTPDMKMAMRAIRILLLARPLD